MADHLAALAALLDRFEHGAETPEERATIRLALLAAADGQPIAALLRGVARTGRDDALRTMRVEHFANMPPSAAAKAMAKALARRAASAWRTMGEPPRAGTLQRACHEVLNAAGGEAPSWRTIFRALPQTPLSVAKHLGSQGGMDHSKC